MRFTRRCCILAMVVWAMHGAWAQEIYVCTDANGRKLTSDRPILDCLDREQRVISPSGMVVKTIGPSLTAQERAVLEATQKKEAEEQARLVEDRKRDRALLLRYPNRAAHDRERQAALGQVDEVIRSSQSRLVELAEQRKELNMEMEFYKRDPSKAPALLKRRISENEQSVLAQERFMVDQDLEKARINQRFDEELLKLKPRWALFAPPTSGASAPATPATGR